MTFSLREAEMGRTECGLILPNRRGLVYVVVGTLATEQLRGEIEAAGGGAGIAEHEAAVIIDYGVFNSAARDHVSRITPLRPPQ